MGINTTRLKLGAFAFSAMWAGFAGVLWTAKLDYTNPMYYYFMQSAMILAMVVLGGMGSIPGAMLGAFLLYFITNLLVLYGSRIREYYADRGSVKLGNKPHALASALYKLVYGSAKFSKESLKQVEGCKALN